MQNLSYDANHLFSNIRLILWTERHIIADGQKSYDRMPVTFQEFHAYVQFVPYF